MGLPVRGKDGEEEVEEVGSRVVFTEKEDVEIVVALLEVVVVIVVTSVIVEGVV